MGSKGSHDGPAQPAQLPDTQPSNINVTPLVGAASSTALGHTPPRCTQCLCEVLLAQVPGE